MPRKSRFARKVSNVSFAFVLSMGAVLPYGVSAAGTDSQSSREALLNQSGFRVSSGLNAATISPQVDTRSLKRERVIVQLSREPLAVALADQDLSAQSLTASATEKAIDTQQSYFLSQAAKLGIDVQVNYTYDTVLNGMEITVAANDIPKLAAISGVLSIDANQTYYEVPLNEAADTSLRSNFESSPLQQIGATEAWQAGFTGKGLKVGVIDTGVDYFHPDLKDAYKGGYDSFEKDNDPYEEPPIEIDGTTYEGTSHGTHVSGTIVGRATNPTSELVQKGIAYEADLYVYKVLGRNIQTGRASGSSAQVIDGIEHAVKDGMDVINLSLGSDSNKDPNSPDAIAINNAVLSGVTAVLATGNAADEGPYYYSLGSPATSQLGISVGAVTTETKHYTATVTPRVSLSGGGNQGPDSLNVQPAAEPAQDPTSADTPAVSNESSPENAPSDNEQGASSSETVDSASPKATDSVEVPTDSPTEVVPTDSIPQENLPSNEAQGSQTPSSLTVTNAVYTPYQVDILAWKTGQENFGELLGTDPVDAVYANLGTDADYEALAANGIDVTGKVMFVSRGALSFDAKVQGAKAHGAKAIVIFNGNVDPNHPEQADLSESIAGRNDPLGSYAFLGDSFGYVPYFDFSGTQGRAIARQLVQQGSPEFQISFGSDFTQSLEKGDHMASFSSRGPNGDDKLSIKPDVVAPGVNILSTYPEYSKGDPNISYDEAYARSNGTSMATPHVAGLALLLKQKHPDWTPFEIRAALANTADTIYDEEGTRYDAYSQGAGRANVAKALNTPALLEAVEPLTILNPDLTEKQVTNYSPSTSFGVIPASSDEVTQELQLKNTSDQPVTYMAKVQWNDSVTSDPNDPIATPDPSKIDVTLSGLNMPGGIQAGANETSTFNLTIDPADDAAKGVYEGEVILKNLDQPTLHLPFVVHIGDETPATGFGVQNIKLTDRIVQPHGKTSSTDVSFTLSANDVNYIQIAAVGIDDEYVGLLGVITDEDAQGNLNMLQPGSYTFEEISDLYLNEDTGEFKRLPNNNYQIQILAAQLTPQGKIALRASKEPISYEAYSSFRIQDGEGTKLAAAEAKIDRATVVANTTSTGQAVLKLPTDATADYKVVASSNESLIDSNGVLKALPTSDKAIVVLTVNVVSKDQPEDFNEVKITVTLNPVPTPGGGGSSGGGGGSSVPVPSAPVTNVTPVSTSVDTTTSVVSSEQKQTILAPSITKSADGSAAVTVTDKVLTEALKSAGTDQPIALVLSVPTEAGQAAQVTLTPAQRDLLTSATTPVTLIIASGSGAVALPAAAFASVPQGSSLQLRIAPAADSASTFSAYSPGASVIGTPVSFEMSAVDASGKVTDLTSTGSVFVTRSFTLNATLPAGGAGVVYEENGSLYPVASKFEKQADGKTLVTVSRPGFSTYAVVSASSAFTDVSNSWAKDAIEKLSGKLLFKGVSDTAFAPKQSITRAEFAALLTRSLGLKNTSAATFSDVQANAWYADDVAAAYEAGLIRGTGDGKFDPNAVITREQLAILLTNAAKLLKLDAGMNSVTYADASSFAGYAQESIASATGYGLLQGDVRGGKTYFDPKASASREAAAQVLEKLLHHAGLIES